MNENYHEYLEFAKKIALTAGGIMKCFFNEGHIPITLKGDRTALTVADTTINDYLIECVKKLYPTHAVMGEEKDLQTKSDYVWVCDPVDGTSMYARYIPVSVFSLALVIKGESILGVVYDPFTESMYTAIKGEGAYKNGVKISVNDFKFNDRGNSVANFEMWPEAHFEIYNIVAELGRISYFVNIGSIIRASVAVASGKFTAAIFPGVVDCCHDIAAIKVVVEEAGGKVTSLFGEEERYDKKDSEGKPMKIGIITGALVSNGIVHDEIINTIGKYHDKNDIKLLQDKLLQNYMEAKTRNSRDRLKVLLNEISTLQDFIC